MARINDIFSQAFDANGAPLSGGKLYFYATGTSTPKTTYSDEGLTTPNANPVILDAAGVPGDIFYTGSAKIVLKDADDVQLRVLDPVDACCASEGGGGGGEPTPWWTFDTTAKTSGFTASVGTYYFVDINAGDITMTFPASPSVGDRVGVRVVENNINYYLTLDGGSNNVEGDWNGSWSELNMAGDKDRVGGEFIFLTTGWFMYASAIIPPPA